ncbi:MAG: hypothetical protein COU08_03400 [Candidatus Harrisonbacteria bacterium CG10_big_fil_rev_8_21_14_0_10_42_17]|uniref:Restriction endonuclease n=1 Tax=Candidatus Harrisonbacteria bacterium CG10_big_fil_rev_8_21_14_0_10_42_17 TaxID=1974584 RepID=A0A2M6WHI1_9BACT|nr:MAG: hypothetical protein COU08_03400 [Candidatus Harrisonbacteria bacterium CG10_big_fil_rev_8_21_14_0_10_42_17]
MIYAEKKNANEENFINLLEKSKGLLVSEIKKDNKISALDFEELVCKKMCDVSVGTEFEGTIKQTGVLAFPDIVANGYFGVEVKVTTKNHWTSTGNSILESSRAEDVERIFIMFGKLGGEVDVRYRLYQECLPEISVTHSPRYKINMDLPKGESIFDKMGVDYDILRKSDDSIQQIKSYYRGQLKDGEGLWWIDEESESPSPIIKQFRSLESEDKERFKVDCMILFPELFKSRANYERAAAYMITEFGAVSTSLRDAFSAGGQQEVLVAREKKSVSQILSQLHDYVPKIVLRINEIDEELLKFYWQVSSIEVDRIEQWKELIDKDAVGGLGAELPSEVFQSGYEEANS